MTINITPDYNLYIQIIFVLWILKGIVQIIVGLAQVDKQQQNKYGIADILCGGTILLLATWVLF